MGSKVFLIVMGIVIIGLLLISIRTGIEWRKNMFGAKVLHLFTSCLMLLDITLWVFKFIKIL